MKFVDATSGADVVDGDAFHKNVLSADDFAAMGAKAKDGVIEYTVAVNVNSSNKDQILAEGASVGNTLVVAKMSFKTIADGKLGVDLHEDNKLNAALPQKTTEIGFVPSVERVGEIAYVSASASV